MTQVINIKQSKQKVESKLFETIYQLLQVNQQIKNHTDLYTKIQAVSVELQNQAKTNIEQIERVCKGNSKLFAVARLLREHSPPKGVKQNTFWMLISGIINMFTLMMSSPKMIQFFNKLSIPFSIYRIILRIYISFGKFQFLKKIQIERSLKFILKMLNTRSKNFPRLYASLILSILNQYSQKYSQKDRRPGAQDLGMNRDGQRIQQCMRTISNIALDLIKLNLRLSAQSGVLVAMYRKAIENDLSLAVTTQLIQIIAQHMNTQDNRNIVLANLDLCRVFSLFTNVDLKFKDGKNQERIQKCAMIIQMALSHCSILFYFIHEKVSLKNFIISLKSKSKNEKQLSIINQKIFKKLIDKALRYDRNKMQRSNNVFGLNSNYLNYKALLILSYLLDNTQMFQFYLNTDLNGSIFAGLGKISLMYNPITFQKVKYNKEIIQTIKLSSASDYQRLDKNFLSILSYYEQCIIPYQFTRGQLISYLLFIKQLECFKTDLSEETKDKIQELLEEAKQTSLNEFNNLLLAFYIQTMKICQILPWKPEYLKLTKFLSLLLQYLRGHNYQSIMNACLNIVQKIFKQPKPNYYRYLYITALDDAGKYFQDHERVQSLILNYSKNYEYAFRISRILLHTDINKNQGGFYNHKKILQTICQIGCEELIFQVFEIIRFYCIDYDDKSEWASQLISQKLIYSSCEEIACAAVQFCQQFIINHRTHKLIYKIVLGNIKEHNLRKRIMYLLLNSEKGIQLLNAYSPTFIKDEMDLWLKQGPNMMKEFSSFISKQNKKFILNKEPMFLDIGKVSQNRHTLIFLPWNVNINQKSYIALASYKYLQEKIKLKVTPQLLVETKIQITYFDIGGFSVNPEAKNVISVKRQEVMKSYQRNRNRENKEIKKFAIFKEKQNATLYFKYQSGCLVLKKVLIEIPLTRDVYRSISYPLSFLSLLTKTGKGLNYLREQKFIQQCIAFLKIREDKQMDIQLSKQLTLCNLEVLSDAQVCYLLVLSSNYNSVHKFLLLCLKQILLKDQQSIKRLIANSVVKEGYQIVMSILLYIVKNQADIERYQIKRNQMVEYFKKPENSWEPKLLERIVMYLSIVNYGIEKTQQVLDLFTPYYLSEKFDADFTFGTSMP